MGRLFGAPGVYCAEESVKKASSCLPAILDFPACCDRQAGDDVRN